MNLTRQEAVQILTLIPYKFGQAVGFNKLEQLHNEWLIDMIFGTEDETLQAHRGSYKTTCDSVAFAVIIILYPNDKTLFMRKTDDDVKEVITQTKRILKHPITREFVKAIWGIDLRLAKDSATEITTNLTNDPRGAAQLTGI